MGRPSSLIIQITPQEEYFGWTSFRGAEQCWQLSPKKWYNYREQVRSRFGTRWTRIYRIADRQEQLDHRMDNQSYETDILIIGSGGGGMTAALVAHDAGLRTLIVEKTPYYGGTTACSGGGIWIPNNYLMRQAGVDDSLDLARTYMQATIGNRTPQASQDAYLHNAARMIEWLRDHTDLKWRYMPGYPDYYPERPGGKAQGRAVEAELFDGNLLGADRAQLNPSPIEVPGGMAFTASEYRRLGMVMRTWQGKLTAMRILLRLIWARLTGKKTLMMGRALIARLRLSLKKRDIPLWLNTPLQELILENGRVVGAQVERDGKALSIYARKGVILAAGCRRGFRDRPSI